ncbi:hypothetical protein Z945_2962 [Sulfitobacter noctilucae]|nr:hypothetical protein Z945_2962 [Sulfitobacter noctilucae]
MAWGEPLENRRQGRWPVAYAMGSKGAMSFQTVGFAALICVKSR